MLTVSKHVLKAKMLEYFRQVEATGEELVVTHHHKPVLRITPVVAKRPVDEIFADLRGKVKYHGDLLEPETAEWPEV